MKERKLELDELKRLKKEKEHQEFLQKIENEKVLSHRIANNNLFQI